MEEDLVPDHKLCGFLCVVLSVNSPPHQRAREILAHKTRCFIFGEGAEVGFRAEGGALLSPVVGASNLLAGECISGVDSFQKGGAFDSSSGCASSSALFLPECSNGDCSREISTPVSSVNHKNVNARGRGVSSSKGKARRIGLVNGSMSVIHQLNALVAHKCLSIVARVLHVEEGSCGESRAAVLVDVYLPIAAWSGWQFPQSRAVAGSLFNHLRSEF